MTSFFDDVEAVFPNNAIELIATRLQMLYPNDLVVRKRPLRNTDPTKSVGIFPTDWLPDETSFEFKSLQPTVQTYLIKIQAFCKDTNEEKGIATHSVMSKVIRSMLYNDEPLNVGLNALSVTMDGTIERIQRRGIRRQRYISNEIDGTFLYLSTLEVFLETETK